MLLYYRDRKSEFPRWMKWVLGISRFMVVALIAFLLLSPMLKQFTRTTENPIIIIAQDNSMSVVMNEDSSFYRNEYLSSLNRLIAGLNERYEVRLFTFGEEARDAGSGYFDTLAFDDRQTDISALFEMMDVRFSNRNTGALVIASDGIINMGVNPLYHPLPLSSPVYTIALGDTSVRRDVFIKRVQYNKIAFEGNDFPVEIILNANKMPGATINVDIVEGNNTIRSLQLPVEGSRYSKILNMAIPAGGQGTHHYVLKVRSNMQEVTMANNRYDIFVEVLKSKQKVLILANSPHPDLSAVKEAVESNINYEADLQFIDGFTEQLEGYNLVVLHQLPSVHPASPGLMNRLRRAALPVLYIVGEQSSINAFNGMSTGTVVYPYAASGRNEALPVLNESFAAFGISNELSAVFPSLPPLNTAFAKYETVNAAGALLYQKISNLESSDPLLAFNEVGEARTGVVLGTGIWKWRIKAYMLTGSHEAFNELVNKIVQFLSLREDKRRFRVNTRESYPENESIELSAELYDQSYEAFNDPDVDIAIRDERGNTYDYTFSRNDQGYMLDVAGLKVGTYTYKASTRIGEQAFSDEGGFTVSPVVAEQLSLRASHGMLQALAEKNGGQMLGPGDMDKLPELLDARGDIKPLIHSAKRYIALIDLWWILLLIIGLMGFEWFLRKWSGSY